MAKYAVCKTLVAHPNKPTFLLITSDQVREFTDIQDLAQYIRENMRGQLWLKNEAPGDLLFHSDKGIVTVRATVRLPVEEVRRLEVLLRS